MNKIQQNYFTKVLGLLLLPIAVFFQVGFLSQMGILCYLDLLFCLVFLVSLLENPQRKYGFFLALTLGILGDFFQGNYLGILPICLLGAVFLIKRLSSSFKDIGQPEFLVAFLSSFLSYFLLVFLINQIGFWIFNQMTMAASFSLLNFFGSLVANFVFCSLAFFLINLCPSTHKN